MAHFYYVIYFDEETKEWVHDCDTESVRFDEGTIWSEEDQEWTSGYLGDGVWNETQEKVDEIFADGLTFLNRISAVWHLKNNKEN